MRIEADNEFLEYSGRIDFEIPKKSILVYPCSYVKLRFVGTYIEAIVTNKNNYWDNYLGVIIDGTQSKVKLSNDESEVQRLILAEHLDEGEHEIMLFKRQDACHHVTFYGFELNDGAKLLPLPPTPERRIEVYGDSVSAGEVSEAIEYIGKEDPKWHKGELSNSYYSYSWLAARALNAQLHDIAQGGIALLDQTGWFNGPNYIGMKSTYDKVQYNPALGESKQWDFSKFTPHVVVVAIGQNDNNPEDYMKEDPHCEKAALWKKEYGEFVLKLREKYPKAHIILSTTILCHDKNWDDAIDEVCKKLNDKKIHHFLYSNNGAGTPGHIRISEAEKMADELKAFIVSFGDEVWQD